MVLLMGQTFGPAYLCSLATPEPTDCLTGSRPSRSRGRGRRIHNWNLDWKQATADRGGQGHEPAREMQRA
uniref:Uncharacterized protein n=1 Tax=Oryza punctata TaxID=4537 RepID=A0A0E0KSR1_ORYPU